MTVNKHADLGNVSNFSYTYQSAGRTLDVYRLLLTTRATTYQPFAQLCVCSKKSTRWHNCDAKFTLNFTLLDDFHLHLSKTNNLSQNRQRWWRNHGLSSSSYFTWARHLCSLILPLCVGLWYWGGWSGSFLYCLWIGPVLVHGSVIT